MTKGPRATNSVQLAVQPGRPAGGREATHVLEGTPIGGTVSRLLHVSPGQVLFDVLFVFQRPELGDEDFARGMWTQLDDGHTADASTYRESPGKSYR